MVIFNGLVLQYTTITSGVSVLQNSENALQNELQHKAYILFGLYSLVVYISFVVYINQRLTSTHTLVERIPIGLLTPN